jgi:hypothetical protein
MKTLRTLAAVAAALALLAAAPVLCPCVEPVRSPAADDGHDCCAPKAGLSTLEAGCCDATAAALPDGLAAAAAADAATPVEASWLRPLVASGRALRLPNRPAPLAPSPPAILRI